RPAKPEGRTPRLLLAPPEIRLGRRSRRVRHPPVQRPRQPGLTRTHQQSALAAKVVGGEERRLPDHTTFGPPPLAGPPGGGADQAGPFVPGRPVRWVDRLRDARVCGREARPLLAGTSAGSPPTPWQACACLVSPLAPGGPACAGQAGPRWRGVAGVIRRLGEVFNLVVCQGG